MSDLRFVLEVGEQVDCVIFDLDGTLLDTSPGIMESVRYAVEKCGFPELSEEQLLTFMGPPLRVSFEHCYGCDESDVEQLTSTFREHYRGGALLNARPYDGIFELCAKLKNSGMQLAVATNKPQVFAEQLLKYYGFDEYITIIHGADMAGHLTKTELIRSCIEESQSEEYIMVGDTDNDAKGAQQVNIPFVGVRYGFGDPQEIRKYPIIGMADEPLDLLSIIINESEDR